MMLPVQATEQLQLDPEFSALWDFFLPAILGALAVLLADAKKWVFSGQWSWGYFFNTKILPFLLSMGVAVVVYLLLAYLPAARPFVEILSGYELIEITSASLIGMATAIIDGFMKPTVQDPQTRRL